MIAIVALDQTVDDWLTIHPPPPPTVHRASIQYIVLSHASLSSTLKILAKMIAGTNSWLNLLRLYSGGTRGALGYPCLRHGVSHGARKTCLLAHKFYETHCGTLK